MDEHKHDETAGNTEIKLKKETKETKNPDYFRFITNPYQWYTETVPTVCYSAPNKSIKKKCFLSIGVYLYSSAM